MAKQTNIVTLPSVDDAIMWYSGSNPNGDYPEFPADGTVIVKTEDGYGLEPFNNFGVIFEAQLENRVISGEAFWNNDEKTIDVDGIEYRNYIHIDTSYDSEDPGDALPITWEIRNPSEELVASGTGNAEEVELEFGQNEGEYGLETNFRVQYFFTSPESGGDILFKTEHLYVNQGPLESPLGIGFSTDVAPTGETINVTVPMLDNADYWSVSFEDPANMVEIYEGGQSVGDEVTGDSETNLSLVFSLNDSGVRDTLLTVRWFVNHSEGDADIAYIDYAFAQQASE